MLKYMLDTSIAIYIVKNRCWVITQVTGAVVPALHLPDSIPSIVVWLAVIGFPFVLVFSWVKDSLRSAQVGWPTGPAFCR
jgi:hypothetical protein